MKTAIVTGANGFVGHHLVKELSDNNYIIYAIIRNKNENIDNIVSIKNCKIIYCDMSEIYNLEEYFANIHIDYVYHLAWAGSSGELRKNYELQICNSLWTLQLIDTIHKLEIDKILIAGSVTQLMYREYLQKDEIFPELVTLYAISKMNTEYMAKCMCTEYKIDLCWTYISNFYGADDTTNNFINTLIDSYTRGIVPELTPAEQLSDFTYVSDVARALRFACEKGKKNNSYYIGYGDPKPLKEYIIEIRNSIDSTLDTGVGKKDFNGSSIDFDSIDVKKLSRDTGYKPKVSFEEGIKMCLKQHNILA